MKAFLFSCCLLLHLITAGQTREYQNLIDTVFSRNKALVIFAQPVSQFELVKADMHLYAGNYQYLNNKQLDTVMFAQIMENALHPDTSWWRDEELKKHLIVKSRNEKITREYAITKRDLNDPEQMKLIENQVNTADITNSYYRNIYYFSRPVFDNTKHFAIVLWQNGHAGKAGGGGIILYQLSNNTWKEAGLVTTWVY